MDEKTINYLKKEFYKELLAEYVARVIRLEFRAFGNANSRSYSSIFHSCLNNYRLNSKERKILFDSVDQILLNKYKLLIANAGEDQNLYLVDLEEVNEEC